MELGQMSLVANSEPTCEYDPEFSSPTMVEVKNHMLSVLIGEGTGLQAFQYPYSFTLISVTTLPPGIFIFCISQVNAPSGGVDG